MRLELTTLTVPLRRGVTAAHGTVADRELIHLVLHADDGTVGYGEAAPLPSYDGVSVAAVRAALEDCREVLAEYPGHAPIADVIARCGERTVLPQALSAIDLALWDLAGRLAAVRAFAGPHMAIRIDANGAWTRPEAAAALRALEPVGIELCEEPVHGLAEIAALRGASGIPLALDETALDPGALTGPPVAELVCLKVARCGGIGGTLAAADRARAAGYEVFLASTFDGPLGIAAALHAACVIRPGRACGLATLGSFAGRPDPLPVHGGSIAVPETPGLGAGLAEWY